MHGKIGDLLNQIKSGRVNKLLDGLGRNRFSNKRLEAGYREMARDEQGEAEALEWAEAMVGGNLKG
jgi:hypothetical protein